MTTKAELIEFIQKRYSDDEQLVWQIVSRDDLVDVVSDLNTWERFVAYAEQYSTLATPFSDSAVEQYQDFAEKCGEEND
jgi:hypothetical protein